MRSSLSKDCCSKHIKTKSWGNFCQTTTRSRSLWTGSSSSMWWTLCTLSIFHMWWPRRPSFDISLVQMRRRRITSLSQVSGTIVSCSFPMSPVSCSHVVDSTINREPRTNRSITQSQYQVKQRSSTKIQTLVEHITAEFPWIIISTEHHRQRRGLGERRSHARHIQPTELTHK